MKRFLLIVFLLTFIIACGNVKDLKFTSTNQDEVLEKVKKSKDLTAEEVALLTGALMRSAFTQSSLDGKTVGALITEQKQFLAEADAKDKEAKKLAAEAAEKEALLIKELSKDIMVSPFKKSFRKANFEEGTYQDKILISFVFVNKSTKDIRAFKGTVIFNDLFGKKLKETNLSYEDGIKAGQKKNWVGELPYNDFLPGQRTFRDATLDNIKFEWQPQVIIFTDESKIGLEEKSE